MEEQPSSVRIYPGDLRPVYYTSVLAFRSTSTIELIRLSLERLQIFEDKSLYELFEGAQDDDKEQWTKLVDEDTPIIRQEKWKSSEKEMRLFLRRKEHASLVLTEIVSQYISPEVDNGKIEDMCNLEELSEQAMLSNLRGRFSNKEIYTYVGSILISVNPYYYYSIYNPKYTTQYVGKPFSALPPHIFATADNAYHSMLNERQNQSVIISGESGAGKTESTKFLLHHLMSLSAKMDESQSLELITLGTGPVLEAFGNAMTVANNNSSRFGKFIEVNFKENGAYQGASIEKYLLEKSRIISQAPGERNYHVFYYLLQGAESDLQKQLNLLQLNQYCYLTQGSSIALPNSAEEYHRLRQSLSMLSFSANTQMRMFTVLSAILHIGNIAFTKKEAEEAATIENTSCLKSVSDLLQVDERTLWLALTTRKSKAGGTDCIVLPYRVEEAVATRDSLAKALYGALFDWIVDKVNISLSSGWKRADKGYSIGVLDIFGFEVFQKNSFEQFCINYANEQLQQYFNKHIFKLEQDEYQSEGIEWSSVPFVDNQDCLDLVAKKPTGLLPLLDEECSFPGADNNSLYQKFERQHKNHTHYHSPQMKLKDPQFTILHYASEVTYSIKDFRAKNRDLMRHDIVDVLKTSKMDLVRALIGLPPYAVHRWHSAYLKVMAGFAFKKAGEDHKEKRDSRFSSSLHFRFRAGSIPALPHNDQRMSGGESGDLATLVKVPGEGAHDSPDAFPLEYGGKLKTGLGIRTSRSYDLLTNAVGNKSDDKTDGGELSHSCSSNFLYGSPRLVRKPKRTASSPQEPLRPKKPPVDPPKTKKLPDPLQKGKSPEVKGEQSQLSSISGIQEKLKKRGPRSLRNKESSENKEHHTLKFWRSAPRVRSTDNVSDPRLLRSMSRRGPSKTVGGQFQASLTSLMERLEKTNPFFIRCIKSNGEKAPCKFDDDLVLRQLRYTGMMETVKIRKAGYSVRTAFDDFYERYQFLMGSKQPDLGHQIKLFLDSLGFGNDDIQIGKTKVFMREKQKQALQTELGEKVLARIIKIQRWVRAKNLRCRYLHMRRCAVTIQCAVRCFFAKKRTDKRRSIICKAVLLQSAWRSFLARKRFIMLKQAAILLQAHWRGRSARRMYTILLEEIQEQREKLLRIAAERQRAEEEEALKREKIMGDEALQDEVKNQGTLLKGERSNRASLNTITDHDSLVLDSEVKDVLFQFDTIMDALEGDLLLEPIPNPVLQVPGASFVSVGVVRSEPTSPCDVEAPELLRLSSAISTSRSNLPNVRELQKQFLFSRDSDGTKSKQLDMARVKVNVQNIIQQLRVKQSSPSPEPPVGTHRPRSNSKTIQNKITELTTSTQGEVIHYNRRSYTPPLVRRKIKSPFLERSTSEKDFDSILADSDKAEVSHPLGITSTTPSPLPEEEKVVTTDIPIPAESPDIVHPSLDSPHSEVTIQAISEEPPDISSHSKNTTSILADSEKTVLGSVPENIPEELATTCKGGDNTAELAHNNDISIPHKSPTELQPSPQKSLDTSIPHEPHKEAQLKQPSPHKSPDKVFVMIRDDYPRRWSPRKSLNNKSDKNAPSDSEKEINKRDSTVKKSQSHSPDKAQIVQEQTQVKDLDRKRSAVLGLDDVMLSFDLKESAPEEQPDDLLFNDQSTDNNRVELIVGVKENGVFEAPPRMVDSAPVTTNLEAPQKNTSHYDHLLSKTHYDHLPPVEDDELLELPAFRNRSASDVTSHRLHPVAPPPADSDLNSSAIVPREYSSNEHYLSSLQRRRKAAYSVADPTDLAITSLEDSSEFTKGLTTEEIARLNQRKTLSSPSERASLFSFHKRHLKLPFRHKGKKERDKLISPDKESRSSTPTRHRKLSSNSFKSLAAKKADGRLAHNFKQTTGTRFSIYACEVCHKGFTGFLKHALKCVDCELMIHRHCDDRAPPCKAKIESGKYVTMSRKKVVTKVDDLDNLGRFLLDKIAVLSKNTSPGSVIDRVFKLSLMEFHTSLISSYSLSLQSSGEVTPIMDKEGTSTPAESKMVLTFSQLVNNFSNIFKGIAKREGLSDSCIISIGVNQIKTMLDEFGKARRFKRSYSSSINPSSLMRKTKSGKDIQAKVHKGHKFYPQQFKVATVCEFCSYPIRLLENGEVCGVCGYTCHENCFKKTNKKCEGKTRSKPIPQYNPSPKVESNQFGKPLEDLVPPNSNKVPPILETCFSYLETNGLYTQGVYRRSAGVSSKKAVRSALEEDPENAKLDSYSVHAVASAVGSFFRELPEPLLTRELYVEFLRAMDLSNKKERLETLHQLISRLPAINHAVFERLIFHLARFAQHEHINKMTPNNLAIIFAPCLLQGPTEKSPDEILKDLEKQTLCLEAIITEQVEKLTATIRDIRTLDIYVRNTTSKLSKLIDQFDNTQQPPSEPSSEKGSLPTSTLPLDDPKETGSEEKRKQLTETLEELERERVQLTVNLPKLEPFFDNTPLSEDELERTSGESDKWHSPSPTTLTRARGISPIRESSEPRMSWTLDVTSDTEERQSRESTPSSQPSSPHVTSPVTPTIRTKDDGLPVLPSGPALTHLTKNRTSKQPSHRPPTAEQRRKLSGEESSHPISPLAKESHYPSTISELEPSSPDYWSTAILRETTV